MSFLPTITAVCIVDYQGVRRRLSDSSHSPCSILDRGSLALWGLGDQVDHEVLRSIIIMRTREVGYVRGIDNVTRESRVRLATMTKIREKVIYLYI